MFWVCLRLGLMRQFNFVLSVCLRAIHRRGDSHASPRVGYGVWTRCRYSPAPREIQAPITLLPIARIPLPCPSPRAHSAASSPFPSHSHRHRTRRTDEPHDPSALSSGEAKPKHRRCSSSSSRLHRRPRHACPRGLGSAAPSSSPWTPATSSSPCVPTLSSSPCAPMRPWLPLPWRGRSNPVAASAQHRATIDARHNDGWQRLTAIVTSGRSSVPTLDFHPTLAHTPF